VEKRTDTELVARARSGDKRAFDQLVARYQPLAQRVARRMVADAETARDLAQEAMLQAYLSLGHLQDDSRFQSWLHGIVRNVCRSYLRDLKANWLSLETLAGGMMGDGIPLSGSMIDPQSAVEERERGRAVSAAMSSLPPTDRAVARLFYDEQLSLKEIAAVVGLTVRAVKNRLYRARKQLRERLLPAYPEMDGVVRGHPRRKDMIKAIIDGVYEEERPEGRSATVVLRDEAGGRTLRVTMGPADARAIDMGRRNLTLPRPLTFTFMAGLLEAAGARLEEVRIEGLREGILYAVARLSRGKTVKELDARPSDALSLAVQTGSPIYVAEAIMGQAGRDAPHDAQKGEALAPSDAPIPELLPILPLRDRVYFPRTLFPIFVGREKSLRALDEAQAKDRYVLVLTQKQGSVDDPQPDDIYQVGTVCRLLHLLLLPDRTVRAMIEGVARGQVLEYRQTEPFHLARVQVLPEVEDTSPEAEALAESFLERYQQMRREETTAAAPALVGMKGQGPGHLADTITSGVSSLPLAARQEILETIDPRERLEKLSSYLAAPADPPGQGEKLEEKNLWQLFTERARRVTYIAQEEAAQWGEIYVGTEHLLLGLTRVPDSAGAQVLVRLGISLESVGDETRQQMTRGTANPGQAMQLTPRAKKVIDLAYEEARLLNNNYIGVEHLLLGLIREGEGLAAKVLTKLGADLERARREVQSMQARP
jgi:RNA polymerase sigma factor (sigma-70 family)